MPAKREKSRNCQTLACCAGREERVIAFVNAFGRISH
jgi:hypothetical protein